MATILSNNFLIILFLSHVTYLEISGKKYWFLLACYLHSSGVPRGVWGVQPPPEIPKALQNRAKLNAILKTVKNC